MDKFFTDPKTRLKTDVIQRALEIVAQDKDIKIYIGTDSQNKRATTTYSTVIAFRYPKRGVFYLYKNNRVSRIKDMWTRLSKETEMSIELAKYIQLNSPLKIEAIELDYNTNRFFKSHVLTAAMKGWCQGEGFVTQIKPECIIASKAANYHCRR